MITHSDIFSAPASVRWKRNSMSSTGNSFSLANTRRIRQMVSSQDASRFVNNEGSTNDTARVSKGEDLKEVSSQLGFLRKNYDVNKTINSIRLRNLAVKSFDLQIVQENVKITTSRLQDSRERVKILEFEISKIWNLQEENTMDTFTYRHILERMQASRLQLDLKSLNLNKYLRTNQQVLNQETEKKRRVREVRIQTKVAVKNLESYISRETKEKVDELEYIEKDVKQKKDSSKKREERFRRQIEILEAAADEDRNMRAMQLREGLLLHKFWYFMLQKRLVSDMQKFCKLESAFDDVKKATGMHETSEVIEKLLTREAGYQEIMENISYTKTKIKEYNSKNRECEDKLSLLAMAKTETLNPAKEISIEVSRKQKEIEADHERYQKIISIYKKITSWCGRINIMLDESLSDPASKTPKISLEETLGKEKVLEQVINLKCRVMQILIPLKPETSFTSPKKAFLAPQKEKSLVKKYLPPLQAVFKGKKPEQTDDIDLIKSLVDNGESSEQNLKLKKTAR